MRDDCNFDLQKTIEYIANPNMVIYYNKGRFAPEIYDGEPVERSSKLKKIKINEK